MDTMAVTTQTFPVIFMTKIASFLKVDFPLNPLEQLVSSCTVGAAGKKNQTTILVVLQCVKAIHYSN